MNKLLFLLSITMVMSACSSESPSDENALPPGVMEPVYNNSEGDVNLFPEVKIKTMPVNMN